MVSAQACHNADRVQLRVEANNVWIVCSLQSIVCGGSGGVEVMDLSVSSIVLDITLLSLPIILLSRKHLIEDNKIINID